MLRAIVVVVLALSWFSAALAQSTSTIDPNLPAPNAPLASGPVRSNFVAARSDINNILNRIAGSVVLSANNTFTGVNTFAGGVVGGGAQANYYVRSDGNDAFCTGLSNTAYNISTNPVNCATATISSAVSKAILANRGANGAVVNVTDSPSYTGTVAVSGTWLGAGTLSIVGNCTTPANVVWTTTGGPNLSVSNARVSISCMELRNPTGGLAELFAQPGGVIVVGQGVRFGITDGDQMHADGGTILIGPVPSTTAGSYSIVGSMGSHMHFRRGGWIGLAERTFSASVSVSAGLTASNYFIGGNNARADLSGVAWTGSAMTGLKALIHNNARLYTGGTDCSTLPGSLPVIFIDTWGQCDQLNSGVTGLSAGAPLAADSFYTGNSNTAASTALSFMAQFHAVGANNGIAGFASDAYGIGVNLDTSRLAFGTALSSTAVNVPAYIKNWVGQAYDSTGAYNSIAIIGMAAAESQTNTAHGSFIDFKCIGVGTTTANQRCMKIGGGGGGVQIGAPTGADEGYGSLNVQADIWNNGVAPTGTGGYVRSSGATMASLTVTGAFTATGLVTNADLVSPTTTINGQACTLGAGCTITAAATGVTVGTTTVSGGTATRVLYDNAGVLGEYTAAQLTGQINAATASLSGALPAWPNNTTTFFRGDGTYAAIPFSSITGQTTLAQLPSMAANTALVNATAGSAVPTAFAMPSCSTAASALNWTTSTGYGCNTSITAAAVPASGITGQVALANGGMAANLTASNGGIFYSTASAGAILSGTATAGQMLRSGTSAAPAWSTATWPATTTINQLLYSSSANTVAGLATANSSVLVTDSGGIPSLATAIPNGVTGTTQAVDDSTTKVATDAFVLNQAASATPLGTGTAAVGTSTRYARGDHVHPIPTQMGLLISSITGVNINAANTDNAITITLPPGYTRFEMFRLFVSNCSIVPTTATVGLFTATGAGGQAIVSSGAALSGITSTTDNTNNNATALTQALAGTTIAASLPTPNTIYLRTQTAQGSAGTCTFTFYYFPFP